MTFVPKITETAGVMSFLARKIRGGLAFKLETGAKQSEAVDAPPDQLADDWEELDELADQWQPDDEKGTDLKPSYTSQQITEMRGEMAKLREFHQLAKSITKNSKGKVLLTSLRRGFAAAVDARQGTDRATFQQRALIFTESRRTQEYLSASCKRPSSPARSCGSTALTAMRPPRTRFVAAKSTSRRWACRFRLSYRRRMYKSYATGKTTSQKEPSERMDDMIDPTITCPNCKTEIKLTESLAAPLIESIRLQYDKKIADMDAEVANREAAIKDQQAAITKAKDAIDEQVAEKLKAERIIIAAEEAKKAKVLLGSDLAQKAQELTELQEVLKQRDEKLAEAQKAQAELIRKQRELDDAKARWT